MCSDCINLPSGKSDIVECPSCFFDKHESKPYVCQNVDIFIFLIMYVYIFLIKPLSLKTTRSIKQFWPKVLTEPLAIISICLDGMDDSPSHIIYHHLRPWFKGNLIHVGFALNFNSHTAEFESQLDTMLAKFEDGGFQECVYFSISAFFDVSLIYVYLICVRFD